jgi:hypothetical protein
LLVIGFIDYQIIDWEGEKEENAEDVLYAFDRDIVPQLGCIMFCQPEEFDILSEDIQPFLLGLGNAEDNGTDTPGGNGHSEKGETET